METVVDFILFMGTPEGIVVGLIGSGFAILVGVMAGWIDNRWF